ncbi:Sulfhydryl oxidase 1 [Seminavis robusta]|uniref:Sulfhydryl oxidase n=1 Tax=Seminavis robusta TaxID=568900 RepID=A0A9N8DR40_9STRA|nr:Sulfhydryl oxidase 1 [Seminavis robusta]|eukprot:Sro221_g090960.1 Sulfhydryl oxidase 1 (545) ;mRNA; f:30672-32306
MDLAKNSYLFRDLPNGASAEPIMEHHDETYDNNDKTKDIEMPEFLQKRALYHRVVLFYSPKCPHCIHFAPTYIEFARYFGNLTRNQDTIYADVKVKFIAVSCISYKRICRLQKVNSYPVLKVFPAKEAEHIFHPHELHPLTVLKALGDGFVKDTWWDKKSHFGDTFQTIQAQHQKSTPKKATNTPKEEATTTYFSMTRSQPQVFADAYLSFYNAMKDSVFLKDGALPKIRKQALHQFLQLLKRTLPPWRLGWLVNDLYEDFHENTDMESTWEMILEQFPPPQPTWSPACQEHESPYTCGLWTLLHIITVGVVEYNRQVIHPNKFAVQSVSMASLMLREYIHHFFLCEECSTHFVQAFDACAYRRCQRMIDHNHTSVSLEEWQELPLWLLEFHNGVNIRLQTERWQRQGRQPEPATLEEEEAVLWPPVQECPSCWMHPMNGAASQYNATMMYQYLRLIYWPEDGEAMQTKQEIQAAKLLFAQQPPRLQQRQLKPDGASSLVDTVAADGPYVVVSAAVCGVWLFVLWKKFLMDRMLGIHRTKMRTV